MAVTDSVQPTRLVRSPWAPVQILTGRLPPSEVTVPLILTAALLAGLSLVVVTTPISGRGDFGQWLMTSRYYLGETVPDYRSITALPAAVPLMLAGTQLVVRDPVIVLLMANATLMLAMGTGFYLLGSLVLGSRWAGAFSVVIGLLVSDRFLELFAFGGMLQVTSTVGMCVSIAAFARASKGPELGLRWWLLGTAATALAALAHVGTGLLAVPSGLAAATLAAISLRNLGWRNLLRAISPLIIAIAGVAAYWALVLLPASGDYLTNPASLAYRGPERLFNALFAFWPNIAVMYVGAAALVIGAVNDLVRRRVGGYLFLLAWIAVTWGALLYSIVTGAATDFPRFATPLLAPLVASCAGAVLWLAGALSRHLGDLGAPGGRAVVPVVLAVTIAVLAPLATDRHTRQAAAYQPRDAEALTSAVIWLNETLGGGQQAVLTEVPRDGKWLEGLTGRPALFSQPVRYAFRPIEWQRSVDADAILRTAGAVTSGYVIAQFTGQARSVPRDLLLSINHGGEFVDVLQIPANATVIGNRPATMNVRSLAAQRVVSTSASDEASIRTVWTRSDGTATYTQTVTAWRDGSALELVQRSPGLPISTRILPASGMAFTSLQVTGNEATACFTQVGDSEPCVRIHVSQADARLRATADGALRVATRRSDRIDLLITALTIGEASVGLSLLQPAALAERYQVGAALLYEPDPAYAERAQRLAAIGFTQVRAFGPYRVLVREGSAGP